MTKDEMALAMQEIVGGIADVFIDAPNETIAIGALAAFIGKLASAYEDPDNFIDLLAGLSRDAVVLLGDG